MIDRHAARILAMQALCQLDVQGNVALSHLDRFLADSGQPQPVISYARKLTETAWSQRRLIDADLARIAPDWNVKRMLPVDRNLIRAAIIELDDQQVPPKVIINEAIEIGREYGTAESPAFINGVLDRIWRDRGSEGTA